MRDKHPRGDIYEVEQPSEKKSPPKKPNILLRLLAFLLTLALILGAVALVVYRDKVSFDAFRRWFSYRTLAKSDGGQAESFPHEGTVKDSFVAVNGNLLVCSDSGVRLFSGSGVKYAEQSITLDNPVASGAGSYSLVYDAGGQSLFVYKDKEQAFTLDAKTTAEILSARISPSGYLAVTTQATGHKGSVTVYDPYFQPALQLNLSSSFVTDALVSGDNKHLAAITMGQGPSGFESTLALYALNRTADQIEPDATCPLGGSVILDLGESDTGYWALGDTALTLAGQDGALIGTFDYTDRYLKEFSLAGDDFAALLLGKYRAGTVSDLVVVNNTGTQSATLTLNEQVLSLSASGRYISVLTADRLDIYTSDLEPYATLEGTQGARKILQRPDGTALLISGETARLYIPS